MTKPRYDPAAVQRANLFHFVAYAVDLAETLGDAERAAELAEALSENRYAFYGYSGFTPDQVVNACQRLGRLLPMLVEALRRRP